MSAIAIGRDNSTGIVGVAPDVPAASFYSYGACTDGGNCSFTDVNAGLDWGINHLYGPQSVINMSLESCMYDAGLATEVARAVADGFVVVAGAGNLPRHLGCPPAGTPSYPAALANVLGVSGVVPSLALASNWTCTPPTSSGVAGSNFGAHVDLAAPFEALSAKAKPSGYEINCGTSEATAHVSGVALLLRAANPGLSNLQVAAKLTQTAKDLGPPGRDDSFGYGLVNAIAAVGIVPPTITATVVVKKPKLTWVAIPGATSYRIYRRVNYSQSEYSLWATVSTTSYTDLGTKVSSFYGYGTLPSSPTVSVSYYVTAVTSTGYDTSYATFATYIPIGAPPE